MSQVRTRSSSGFGDTHGKDQLQITIATAPTCDHLDRRFVIFHARCPSESIAAADEVPTQTPKFVAELYKSCAGLKKHWTGDFIVAQKGTGMEEWVDTSQVSHIEVVATRKYDLVRTLRLPGSKTGSGRHVMLKMMLEKNERTLEMTVALKAILLD